MRGRRTSCAKNDAETCSVLRRKGKSVTLMMSGSKQMQWELLSSESRARRAASAANRLERNQASGGGDLTAPVARGPEEFFRMVRGRQNSENGGKVGG